MGPEDREPLMLEPCFLLIYYGGMTWTEAWNLPVAYRRWFIERISKELNKGEAKDNPPTRALHQNSPDVRAMQGHAREQTPSRLRRFT